MSHPPESRAEAVASGENFPGSDYSDEERVFLLAIERYKRRHRRPFPTWREVLAVLHALGYRRLPPETPSHSPSSAVES